MSFNLYSYVTPTASNNDNNKQWLSLFKKNLILSISVLQTKVYLILLNRGKSERKRGRTGKRRKRWKRKKESNWLNSDGYMYIYIKRKDNCKQLFWGLLRPLATKLRTILPPREDHPSLFFNFSFKTLTIRVAENIVDPSMDCSSTNVYFLSIRSWFSSLL